MKQEIEAPGSITAAEIQQQPELWPDTLERVRARLSRGPLIAGGAQVIIAGAGTSAYAATAVEAAWPRARAVPTTDLLPDPALAAGADVMLSLARSGNSPESVGSVDGVRSAFPEIRHVAITCNGDGRLAHHASVEPLLLDPRTNDRSLVMTSSFSNLVLAGLALRHEKALTPHVPAICARAERLLSQLDATARELAKQQPLRMVVLASRPLLGWAQEARLKFIEMTAGRIAVMAESYLGLRHGPMSFVDPDTMVLCLVSTDPHRRRYESDLIAELGAKGLGVVVAIQPDDAGIAPIFESVDPVAPELPDELRTPFEILFPQLLAWRLSVNFGLNPDSPSPDGVITRVVQGVSIYER